MWLNKGKLPDFVISSANIAGKHTYTKGKTFKVNPKCTSTLYARIEEITFRPPRNVIFSIIVASFDKKQYFCPDFTYNSLWNQYSLQDHAS